MTLTDVRDYLKRVVPYEDAWFGIAKMDATKDMAMCLYARAKAAAGNIAVGGAESTGYTREHMTLLIRWSSNAEIAERKAREAHGALIKQHFSIDERECFLQAVYSSPVALGTDNKGVYEYSVDFNIYYERGEKNGISSK